MARLRWAGPTSRDGRCIHRHALCLCVFVLHICMSGHGKETVGQSCMHPLCAGMRRLGRPDSPQRVGRAVCKQASVGRGGPGRRADDRFMCSIQGRLSRRGALVSRHAAGETGGDRRRQEATNSWPGGCGLMPLCCVGLGCRRSVHT